jgi:hypothetical protein
MTLKIFKGVWFLSMLAVMANLLYVYAFLPEQVVILEDGLKTMMVGRDGFFYTAMITIALTNSIVFLFSEKIAPKEDFRAWINGLVISLNIFFILSMSFVGVFNSAEKYDFTRMGLIIYIGIGLIAAWMLAWPIYTLTKKTQLNN